MRKCFVAVHFPSIGSLLNSVCIVPYSPKIIGQKEKKYAPVQTKSDTWTSIVPIASEFRWAKGKVNFGTVRYTSLLHW